MWHYGVCESYHVSVGLCKAHRRARSSRKFEFLCPRRAYVVQRQNSNWGGGYRLSRQYSVHVRTLGMIKLHL